METVLELENGIPSHDTFNRFFSLLNPVFFEEHFVSWIKSISNDYKGVVAIDGKNVRGSKQCGLKLVIDLVSAFSTENEVSSLPCDAKKIENAVRSHWKIENNLHWHLDVSFGEDNSRKRYKNAAQNFSSVLKLSLKILIKETISPVKKSIRRKRK